MTEVDPRVDAEEVRRIEAVLDGLGVPRRAGLGEPVPEGQPLSLEGRVRYLGEERDRARRPARSHHRRVQRAIVVKESELTEGEKLYATPTETPGMFEVMRWTDTDAAAIVKRTFGDDVDLSDGTIGDLFVKMITLEGDRLEKLKAKLFELAGSMFK